MKNILLFTISFFNLSSTLAQTTDTASTKKHYPHSIGLGIGTSNGSGISYRYFPSKLGFQINYISFSIAYTDFRSAGLTGLFRLYDKDNLNFFLYQGNSYNHYYSYFEDDPDLPPDISESNVYANSLGIGTDIFYNQPIGISLMLGGALGTFNNRDHPLRYKTAFGPSVECAIYLKL